MKKLFSIGMIAVLLSVGLQAEVLKNQQYPQYTGDVYHDVLRQVKVKEASGESDSLLLESKGALCGQIMHMLGSDMPINEIKKLVSAWYNQAPHLFSISLDKKMADNLLSEMLLPSVNSSSRTLIAPLKKGLMSVLTKKHSVQDLLTVLYCCGTKEMHQYAREFISPKMLSQIELEEKSFNKLRVRAKELVNLFDSLGVSSQLNQQQLDIEARLAMILFLFFNDYADINGNIVFKRLTESLLLLVDLSAASHTS